MIKGYTDIKQSQILANILPIESADMSYSIIHNIGQEPYHCNVPTFTHATHGDIPCWSLAALLDILHDYTLQNNTNGSVFVVCNSYYPMISDSYKNPIDACYKHDT